MSLTDLREPTVKSTPNGERTDDYGAMDGLRDFVLFPFSLGNVLPRLTNPAEQSAATGSVATNSGPDFLDRSAIFIEGFGKAYKETFDEFATGLGDSGKKLAGGIGSTIASILPWWLWALLGVALVAYIVHLIAPLLKRV